MESMTAEEMMEQASRIVEHNLQCHELRELRSHFVEKMMGAMDANDIPLAIKYKDEVRGLDRKIREASSSSYPSH